MRARITTILLFLAVTLGVGAQATEADLQQIFNRAQEEYNNGLFDKCEKSAKEMMPSAQGSMRAGAYRLLALCSLERGDIDQANDYSKKLLAYDPYYNPDYNDPKRFADIINALKSAAAGITTASKQAETTDEAPVPVTLITEDMIKHSGTQSLAELLSLYVPGMSLSEGPETNMAMHGTYSLTQEQILVLVDGHRLNSSVTNAEALDFRNSLDKVQQIEVLRGPASSLYGNTALTAAVNIITKKGAQMNGGTVSGTIGTQGTYGGSFTVGGGNNIMDIMAWGSIYVSQGFEHHYTNLCGISGTCYSNAYNGKPAYDLGLKGRWKDFTVSLNMQHSKKVPYLNILQWPNYDNNLNPNVILDQNRNFDIDKYSKINGYKPGMSRINSRINIDYSHDFGNWNIQASAYASLENSTLYNPFGDSLQNKSIANIVAIELAELQNNATSAQTEKLATYLQSAPAIFIDWEALTVGVQAQAQINYRLLGHGTVTAGLQYENFSILSTNAAMYCNYGKKLIQQGSKFFYDGAENTYSAYAQTKHYFTPNIILNGGVRFDLHQRYDNTNTRCLSPRVSIICKLSKIFSLRGAYSYSFVDAAYFYRAASILLQGNSELNPTKMHSMQISLNYNKKNIPLKAELNIFYNMLNNRCIFNRYLKMSKNDTKNTFFINIDAIRTYGGELSVAYTLPRLFISANVTGQCMNSSQNDLIYNNTSASTPHCFGNVVAAWAPYAGKGQGIFKGGKVWLRATLHGQSATWYSDADWILSSMVKKYSVTGQMLPNTIEWRKVAPQFNVGFGVGYECKLFDIDLSLKNVTNNEYLIGSMLSDGIPRAGRQFIAKVTFRF